jgi:small nuclear ribonucleoprotein (snRNP)-like protein
MKIPTKQISISVVLLLSLLLAPITLVAQTGANNNWSRVSAATTGTKLAVKLKDGKKVEGTLNSVSDTSLTLTVKNAAKEVRREDIASVHEVSKKSPTKATLIGLGIGAGVGAGLAIASEQNENDTFFETPDSVSAGFVVLTAGIGALAGFLVGRTGKKRVLLYESK